MSLLESVTNLVQDTVDSPTVSEQTRVLHMKSSVTAILTVLTLLALVFIDLDVKTTSVALLASVRLTKKRFVLTFKDSGAWNE
jgi:hypothetical protein